MQEQGEDSVGRIKGCVIDSAPVPDPDPQVPCCFFWPYHGFFPRASPRERCITVFRDKALVCLDFSAFKTRLIVYLQNCYWPCFWNMWMNRFGHQASQQLFWRNEVVLQSQPCHWVKWRKVWQWKLHLRVPLGISNWGEPMVLKLRFYQFWRNFSLFSWSCQPSISEWSNFCGFRYENDHFFEFRWYICISELCLGREGGGGGLFGPHFISWSSNVASTHPLLFLNCAGDYQRWWRFFKRSSLPVPNFIFTALLIRSYQ